MKQRKTTHERAVFLNMLVHGCNRKFSHSVVILASSSPRHHAGEFSLPTTIPWCSSWIFLTMSDSAPSIRALLGPIVEVNRRLDSLLDIQWRLMELRNSLETSHPDMSELLHQSTVGIQRTIQMLRTEQSTLLLIFLQTLQHYVQDLGQWPTLDRDV